MAAGLLLAGCSSDSDLASGGSDSGLFNGKTEGYFKINLNLPTAPVVSTRAGWAESTNLDDGLDKEYDVQSVLFLVFEGASENVATLKQVITPTGAPTSVADDPNQITANKEYIAKLDNAPTSNLYALAVINGTGIIEPGSDNTKVKINGGADVAGINLAGLQVVTNNAMITADKFFMTNAVLSKAKGGMIDPGATPELQILAPIKTEYIYETETAATSGTAATDIYVERGVAKVTVDATSLATTAVTTKDGGAASVSFEGWVLDNTEKESYIVRKVPTPFTWNLKTFAPSVTVDPYRFVGGNAVDAFYGTSHFFRTYWAEDPQYTSEATGKTTTTTPTFAAKEAVGNDYPQYCHENTFPVAQQTHKNTTRAIVKVNLSASDFYTIGADRKTMYTLDNVKDLVKTNLMDQSAFATWWAANSTATLTGAGIKDITFSSTDAGVITVTDITIAKDAFVPVKADDVSVKNDVTSGANMITALNTQLAKVEYFKGGVSYYVIRIKHFGDDLTPWNNGEYLTKPTNGGVDQIYPNDERRDANYLGRYGMVRNNWYDIRLGEILKIGSSTVPSVPGDDTPDDELEEAYIKARINILSWAKRTQNWNLK